MNKALNALRVLLLDPKISWWLKLNDPQAYEQAQAAMVEAEQPASFLLRDWQGEDPSTTKVQVLPDGISDATTGLDILADGYGTKGMHPGYGPIIYLERSESHLVLHVWADINQEDPTHTISLENAREEHRPPDIEELRLLWTTEDERAAIAQGWMLFNSRDHHSSWYVERCHDQLDEFGIGGANVPVKQFKNDEEARRFVQDQADHNDDLAWKAIEFLRAVKSADAKYFPQNRLWLAKEREAAQTQGWDIFSTCRSEESEKQIIDGKPYGHRPFEIQSCDEADIFKGGDLEAHAFVRQNYETGEWLAHRAAEFLKVESPQEYEAVFGKRETV